MPDNIEKLKKQALQSLGSSNNNSVANSQASRNINSQQFSNVNIPEQQEYQDAYAQEIKRAKLQRDEDYKKAGLSEDVANKAAKDSSFWTDIFNGAKAVTNDVIGASLSVVTGGKSQDEENAVFGASKAKSTDQIKDELLTTFNENKSFDRAIKNGIVRNDDFGNTETLAENIPLMEKDDALDNIKYALGIEQNRLGDKKLKISFNDDAQYFFYLDKDENGNDILAKTKIKNINDIKKTGKAVLNAYGPTSFEKGFFREVGAGISNTYAGLAKNLVNFNRGVSNVAASLSSPAPIIGGLIKEYADASTEYGKKFNNNYEIDQSKAGVGETAEYFGAGIGQGASSLAQMAIMGGTGRLLGSIIAPAASATSKFDYLLNFGAGSVLNYNEAYESALQAGLSESKAGSVGLLTGAINGLIESSVGTNRLVNWLGGGGDKALARTVLSELGEDVTESSINKVFNSFKKGLTGDAGSFLNKIFESKYAGSAVEEGLEEFFQTFSQKGVENLYDLAVAGDKKVGQGKFGTEFFSKATMKEALESAMFGAILGFGGDIAHIASEKLAGKSHSSDSDIIPLIAEGKRNEVDAIVKTLHNSKLISDTQKDFYLDRINQLDNMYKSNDGVFSNLDTLEDKPKANNVKAQVLGIINSTFDLNRKTEDLSKQLAEVNSNTELSDTDKQSKIQDLNKEIRNNQLNIKFFNDYIAENFTPREDGKIQAYEDNYLNNDEIVKNKFERFTINEDTKTLDNLINKSTNAITELETQLENPENIVDQSSKEVRDKLNREKLALNIWEANKTRNTNQVNDLINSYNNITSEEYQNELRTSQEEANNTPEEVTVTTPIEALEELQNQNNTNTKEDIQSSPVSQKDTLNQELEQINTTLETTEDLDDVAINSLTDRASEIENTLRELDQQTSNVEGDYNTYLQETDNKVNGISNLDNNITEPALTAIKRDIEQVLPGFNANGIDTTILKQLHTDISNRLLNIRQEEKDKQDEATRLEKEIKDASERDNQTLVSNISFFDRLQRLSFMNNNPNYYTDEEVNIIFQDTPIQDILSNIELVFNPIEDLGYTQGQLLGQFNSTSQIVAPEITMSLLFNVKLIGNLNQTDGFTSTNPNDFNLNSEGYNETLARNSKIKALLKERGTLNSIELAQLGFNINWNGEFTVNKNTPRTLVKDFKLAQLSENDNKPYIYDQVNQLEITEGTVNMRENEDVPPIPKELEDRYVVLVKANNGKFYWVGAQNQVLNDDIQNKLYIYLFKQVGKLKTITDPALYKEEVSKINRYLSDNIFVSIPYASLQLTTPNKTNKGYTLNLKIKGQKGKRVELDQSKFGTISDLFKELGLDKTNLRTTLANNASAKETINKLSINTIDNVINNPILYKQITFKFDNTKLDDMLVNNPIVEETNQTTEDIQESDNPFADYILNEFDTDPTLIIEDITNPLTEKDNSFKKYEAIINTIDPSFNTLGELDQIKVLSESNTLLNDYNNLTKLKKKGVEVKIREIINKYRGINNDPVFSIGESQEIMDYPQAVEWINNHLPSNIAIADINTLLGKIKNNGTTYGAFANNIIYLNNNAAEGTQYHEAFHAVFRTLISDKQIQAAYNLASKKYGKATTSDINKLKNSSSVYSNYTDSQLADLWLEEKMANDFKDYTLSATKNNSGIGAIWNKILNWIKFVSGNMDELQSLFYNINRGKFKNANAQSNIFSSYANQDRVFSIFNKGTDENGNIITSTQLEGQGIVASLTNKFIQNIISNKISKDDYKGRNELLDRLISEKAKFYSINENPYYEQYLEDKGLSDNDNFIDTMSRNLEQKRNIFVLPNNITALKKDISHKAELFDIDEAVDVEQQQSEIDDIGEQFDRDVWTIGGETSFSKVLREYISLTTIKTTDEYGQEIEEAVDFKKVYRGLVRALSSTEEVNVLPRFKALAEFDEDINAVYNRLISDLGLTNEGTLNVQDITKNYDLWRKFVTAFNNENVSWYTILHSKDQSRLIESNNASAKDIQFNEWLQNYSIISEELAFDEDLKKTINSNLDFINRSENITVKTFNEAKQRSQEVKNAFNKVAIRLSNAYITYSLLKKSPYEELDQQAKDYINSFLGVEGLYDGGNIPFIVSEFKSGSNPFISSTDAKGKERGASNRIKQIAEQNALFDPTVGESSFQNADGKNVYSIIRPSFGLVKLRWLVDPIKRQELLSDDKTKKDDFINPLENVILNHLLANENSDLILDTLTPSMIDGYRQTNITGDISPTEEGEGVTFGKFNAQQYLVSDFLMFLSNRKSLNVANESGKINKVGESAMFNINQMEASSTGYGVFLPVSKFDTINDNVTNTLFNYLAQEAIRINKVKNEFGKQGIKTWLGYNDKEGARGFKLMEFTGYGLDELVGSISDGTKTAQEVYDELLKSKEDITTAIKAKLATEIAEYKQTLSSNEVMEQLPKLELIKQGYLKDKEEITGKVLDKLITDQYLNAYINTLGINNLLLDNYAKKVKGTVDWYKRAKGIIGSGPDLGSGITKVAVYQDPVRFIDTKTLSDIDKNQLLNIKKAELDSDETLSDEDKSIALKAFESDINKGKIDIADAQSYITLDHKILELQRWGRFPQKVADIYEKIKLGLPITWDEKSELENNNSALNSTKTVAYNGDYYFKLSELTLSPNLVAAKDSEGKVIWTEDGKLASPTLGMDYLFNKYNAMLAQGVDQALPVTASKMATIAPAKFVEDGKFDFSQSIMDMENKFKRLQVETPSGKSKITQGTQLIQLIASEQDDNLPVDFKYNTSVKTLGDLRDIYRQLLADNRLEGFKTAIAYMRDPLSGEFNSKELTKKFYDTIIASGSDEVLSNFFTPDHNGERQFNWNLGPIVNKAEQLFLAHFGTGVLSQKVPGLKVSLVSDAGIKVKDKKTGELRDLAYMQLDDDGNYYSECLLPPFANELLGKDPSDNRIQEVLKMFGVRIPTDDKHSMMSLKVVGFLPVEYGSIGVFPKQIVYLSGADFDIDSEFIHKVDFYTDKKGIPVPYGTATTDEAKYQEYIKWNLSNNKLLKSRMKALKNSDTVTAEEAEILFLEGKDSELKSVLKALNMPSTLEEFIEQNPTNIGVNNNAMLEAQIKFLTNDYVRLGSVTAPVSTDSIQEAEEIITKALGRNNQAQLSPNTPLSRYRANRSNMQGKDGIGPVALANTTQAFLTTSNQQLFNNVNLPNISGRVSTGFTNINTIGSTTERKFDNMSALLNAMTDNAKLQFADKLNLTFARLPTDTLPVAAYMLGIGYSMEDTMLFLNQPNIRAYVSADNTLITKLYDLRSKVESRATEDVISIKPLTQEYLIDKLNEDNLKLEDYTTQVDILEKFLDLQNQAKYTNNVSSLMSLNKGLKSTFDENLSLDRILESTQLDFITPYITEDLDSYKQLIDKLIDENILRRLDNGKLILSEKAPVFKPNINIDKTPFDARLAILNDANTVQNIIIHKKVMDASKEFFLLNTDVFKSMKGLTTFNLKELIPHFMDKAYRTYLEEVYPEKLEAFNNAYNNAGYMVHKSGANAIGRDLYNLKKDTRFRNNLLIKLLTLNPPRPGSSIVQIEFPTRIKAEGDFYTNLNNAFKELFMNSQTKEFARKLYYYSYFKDGLQFKNKSFINTIPSWVFKDVSASLDLLNEDLKDNDFDNYSSLKQGIVPTVVDMLTSFTKVDKLAVKLPKFKINEKSLFKTTQGEGNSSIISFKDVEGLRFSNYREYIKSLEEVANTNDGKAKGDNIKILLAENDGSIKYDIASHSVSTQDQENGSQVEIVSPRILKSIKGFDINGNPVDMNLNEVTDYYLKNKFLPITYEVTLDKVIPIKENGLNSTITDSQFINNLVEIKKSIPKETTKQDNYLSQEVTEDINIDNIVAEDTNLEISDNNSTFVNPFEAFNINKSISPELTEYDFADFENYQNDLNQSMFDEENLTQLDNDVENYTDDEDNPIC